MSVIIITVIIIITIISSLLVLLQVQSKRQGFGGEEKGILVNRFRTSL
jgi:hypothetical protein